MKNKSDCQLNEHFKSCCCDCVNRVEILNNDEPNIPHIGYGCLALVREKIVMVGDFEHGLCEMWLKRKDKK